MKALTWLLLFLFAPLEALAIALGLDNIWRLAAAEHVGFLPPMSMWYGVAMMLTIASLTHRLTLAARLLDISDKLNVERPPVGAALLVSVSVVVLSLCAVGFTHCVFMVLGWG